MSRRFNSGRDQAPGFSARTAAADVRDGRIGAGRMLAATGDAGPPSEPSHEPNEVPFNQTQAYRVLSHLGALDSTDPTGKTVNQGRKYIRATLPDGRGGVQLEAVYRLDAITNTQVSMSFVEVDSAGKKTVRASSRGAVDAPFWELRTFLVVSEAEWKQGKSVGH